MYSTNQDAKNLEFIVNFSSKNWELMKKIIGCNEFLTTFIERFVGDVYGPPAIASVATHDSVTICYSNGLLVTYSSEGVKILNKEASHRPVYTTYSKIVDRDQFRSMLRNFIDDRVVKILDDVSNSVAASPTWIKLVSDDVASELNALVDQLFHEFDNFKYDSLFDDETSTTTPSAKLDIKTRSVSFLDENRLADSDFLPGALQLMDGVDILVLKSSNMEWIRILANRIKTNRMKISTEDYILVKGIDSNNAYSSYFENDSPECDDLIRASCDDLLRVKKVIVLTDMNTTTITDKITQLTKGYRKIRAVIVTERPFKEQKTEYEYTSFP